MGSPQDDTKSGASDRHAPAPDTAGSPVPDPPARAKSESQPRPRPRSIPPPVPRERGKRPTLVSIPSRPESPSVVDRALDRLAQLDDV
ncbi:MAG TPA: hypothetical protein VF516_45150, partial [Kofleriaceae bacterium]